MICPKCKTTIVEDSRFVICPKCGAMFDTIDVPAHLKTRPNRNPSNTYNRPNDNYNRHTPENKNVPVNEKPNHMKKIVIVVIIAGLALLFISIISSYSSSCTNRGVKNNLDDSNYSYYESNNTEGDDNREDHYSSTTTSTTSSTSNTTEVVTKDWKQAYIDFIYELEDSYDGFDISYSPCADFSGDGIDDFVCSLYKDYFVKDIACVYYNGGVASFSYDKLFAGAAYEDKYLFLWPDEEGDYDVKYYKFSNGQFVFVKNGYSRDAKGTSECHSEIPLEKYEMISEIKNGNDHGFY